MPLGSIQILLGDITTLPIEAIVNAANTSLLIGGGVCGAIHMAAGPYLEEECRAIGPCPVGEARLTKGYNLPAKYVIHAVGPRYWDGTRQEATLLRSCYRSIFSITRQENIRSIAIPAIGTGIHSFPIEEAAQIAIDEAKTEIYQQKILIVICCFDKTSLEAYTRVS